MQSFDSHDLIQADGAILVVDDDQPVRQMMRFLLERAGFRVLEAGNGLQGLELFQANADGVQLLVTDVEMPEMNGIELATQIRIFRPNVPIVFVSGSFAQFDHIAKLSGSLSIDKPFRADELVSCVEKAMWTARQSEAAGLLAGGMVRA